MLELTVCCLLDSGLRFTRETSCEVGVCDNAALGHYYTENFNRTQLVQGVCPTESCNPPPRGRYFVAGFATHPDACPTAVCNLSALPRVRRPMFSIHIKVCVCFGCSNGLISDPRRTQGRYYGPNCEERSCDNPPGYYYLEAAQGGNESCAQVRSKCTNAVRGETYVQSKNMTFAPDGCKVDDCSEPPEIGKYFSIPGLRTQVYVLVTSIHQPKSSR